jgi:hypothetical protein
MELVRQRKLIRGGIAALALSLATSTAMAAQVTGAIFTTLPDGSAVNYNIYDHKEDVYLNGGPVSPKAPCTAAGLPDGEYYFQVTDPSGRWLLSTDDITQRKVRVYGGYIVEYLGAGPGAHTTAVGTKCNKPTLTVSLYPFFDTPNPGGEYKVWMAPVNPNVSPEDFRFIPSQTKTDNFKAVADLADYDNDGLPDGAEFVFGTDPKNPDTDGDGFTDGHEVNVSDTNPLDPNSYPEVGECQNENPALCTTP